VLVQYRTTSYVIQSLSSNVDFTQEKLVPSSRSNITRKKAETSTGKESRPMIAVTKKAQMVNGIRHMLIPLVRRFSTVVI
jgi:hypothetical protein